MEEKKCCKIRLGTAICLSIIIILLITIAGLVYALIYVKNADKIIINGTEDTLSKLENKIIFNNINTNNSTNSLVNSTNTIANAIEQTVQIDEPTTTNATTKTNTSNFDIVYDSLSDYLQNDYQQQANEDKEEIVINKIEIYTEESLLSEDNSEDQKEWIASTFDWDSGKIYGAVTYSIKYKDFDNVVFAGSGDTYEKWVIESRFFEIEQIKEKHTISLFTGW